MSITLTARQTEVFKLLGKGYSFVNISKELGLSYETVRSYAKDLYKKLGVHTNVEAMVMAGFALQRPDVRLTKKRTARPASDSIQETRVIRIPQWDWSPKMKCYALYRHALHIKFLVPLPCQHEGCMETKTDGHHFSYSRPLDVLWLCRKHHAGIDRDKHKGKRGNNRICVS